MITFGATTDNRNRCAKTNIDDINANDGYNDQPVSYDGAEIKVSGNVIIFVNLKSPASVPEQMTHCIPYDETVHSTR